MNGKRESGKSMLLVGHDDDDIIEYELLVLDRNICNYVT